MVRKKKLDTSAVEVGSVKVSPKKKLLKVIAIVVVVLLVAFGLWLLLVGPKPKKELSLCRDPKSQIHQDVILMLNPERIAGLKPLVEKMQQEADFDTSPSCLLPAAFYSVYSGDIEGTKTLLAKLEKALASDVPLASAYGDGAQKVSSIKAQLTALEARKKEFDEGRTYFD